MACILIAEDDAPTARLLRGILEGEGHDVHAVSDGALCLAAARARAFDLALVDIVLPGRSGLEVVEDLRRDFHSIKIIAMSGGGPRRPDQLLVRARELGADRIVHKPFFPDEIVESVRVLLGSEQADPATVGG